MRIILTPIANQRWRWDLRDLSPEEEAARKKDNLTTWGKNHGKRSCEEAARSQAQCIQAAVAHYATEPQEIEL